MTGLPESIDEPDGAERRVAPRKRVLKRAKIVFNNGFSTVDAIVRNISATGALLTIDDAVNVPKSFELMIGDETRRPAKLVYRRSMFAGIRFLDVEDEQSGALSSDALRPSEAPVGVVDRPMGGIRKIEPEDLPEALTNRFAWNR